MVVKSKSSLLLLRQNNLLNQIWDCTIALVVFADGFFIPYNIAFDDCSFTYWQLETKIIFTLDFLLQFRVVRLDTETGEDFLPPKEIAKKYIKTYNFFIDLIVALPTSLFWKQPIFQVL